MEFFCTNKNNATSPFVINGITTFQQNIWQFVISDCFAETFAFLVPAIYLFTCSPFLLYGLLERDKAAQPKIRPKWHNSARILFCALLSICFVSNQILLYLDSARGQNVVLNGLMANPLVHHLCAAAHLLALLTAFIALWVVKRRGYAGEDGILFVFWLLLLVFGALKLVRESLAIFDQNSQHFNYTEPITYFAYYFCVIVLFLLSFIADESAEKQEPGKPCPEQFAPFPSRITYWWFNGMAALGNRRPLEMNDLWELASYDRCEYLVPRFEKAIGRANAKAIASNANGKSIIKTDEEALIQTTERSKLNAAKKAARNGGQPSISVQLSHSLIRPIFRAFKWPLLGATACKLTADLLQFVSPYLLKLLIEYYETEPQGILQRPIWPGLAIALAMFLTALLQSTFNRQHEHLIFRLGMNIRSVLTCAIYKKAISLPIGANQSRPNGGEIVNLVSTDVQHLQDMTQFVMFFWSAPLQIGLALLFLCQLLGIIPVAAGCFCLVASMLLNSRILTILGNYQEKQMDQKDERLNLVREMLNGIKTIKLCAWEEGIQMRISAIRNRELRLLKAVALLMTATCLCWSATPFLVALSTFGCYTLLLGHNLTPDTAFVALSLFNILRMPVAGFATVSAQAAQCAVSNKRLKDFLAEEEVGPKSSSSTTENDVESKMPVVAMKTANFAWDKSSESAILNDIELSIGKGEFVIILGPIGSGKSSLLLAMLNEMHLQSGNFNANSDKIAYVPQQAWPQNASVRENILFGQPYDPERYEQVLHGCAMKQDLAGMPLGDQTVLGEKGTNLSGGQRQRISLARAVYSDHDLFLLDDPLASVDAHVRQHIFEHVLDSKKGILKEKTRIMVTHGVSFLKYADKIVLLKDGKIAMMGKFEELVENEEFATFIGHQQAEIFERQKTLEDDKEHELVKQEVQEQHIGLIRTKSEPELDGRKEEDGEETKKLLEDALKSDENEEEADEAVQRGRVKLSVYMSYFRAIGLAICVLCVFCLVLDCSLGVATNMWLAHWADQAVIGNDTVNSNYYLSIYVVFGVAQATAQTLGTVLITFGMVKAGGILHKKLLNSVLQSKMAFFDVTPMGRVISRFGKDVDTLDSEMPTVLLNFVGSVLEGAAFLCVPILVTFWVAPFFALILVIYAYSARYFIRTSRQLKRLDLATRAPVFSFFEESINGVVTIRAFNCANRFMGRLYCLVDRNLTAYYPYTVALRWLDFRLDFVGNLVVFCSALGPALFLYFGNFQSAITAGMVGLAISYAMQVTDCLNFAVGSTGQMETSILSVERIREFIKRTDKEFPLETPIWLRLGKEWPGRGDIQIANLSVRYRPGLELVLKDINAHIQPGERIGIVGRTGAGKTSLAMAFFRLVDAADGKITVDEHDIARLGLRDLRSRMAIVPQDPVLFIGTLQNNLDPMGECSREQLMATMEAFGLAEFVNSFPDKLGYEIVNGGENLSVGQRQLVCFVRAVLRQAKLLVLDEVVSSMDSESIQLIQQVLQQQCANKCTIISISHNLRTLLDSDRVMVVNEGRLVEFDTPRNLWAKEDSMFRALANAAGMQHF